MFEPDLKLREATFRKMGWKQKPLTHPNVRGDLGMGWVLKAGEFFQELPPIESSWEVCAEYLVPFMRGRGYGYSNNTHFSGRFWWHGQGVPYVSSKVKNDNISEAACRAFLEVTLE